MTTIAIVIAIAYGALVLFLGRMHLLLAINTTAFTAQVSKLVMANSIDKAIKLSNAAPSATYAKAVKAMLVRANRPFTIELEYQAGVPHGTPPATASACRHRI